MAKVSAPLLSLGASGTIADTITMARWRGVPYARQRVIPANPRTAAQQSTRSVFTEGSNSWKTAPSDFVAPWNAFAEGKPLTGRNAYIGSFTEQLRGETDLANWEVSPGARSGQTVQSVSGSAGTSSGEIDMTYSLPPAPSGWTMDEVTFVTAPDQDPSDPWENGIVVHSDTGMTGNYTITGLDASTDYAVGAYITWTRPDGRAAYGASITNIVTSAA